jgi:hypothetical protein
LTVARTSRGAGAKAFDLRKRGWGFGAMAVFWLVMAIGALTNFFAGTG